MYLIGPSLAAASLDGYFDRPAMKINKSTAGGRRQSTLRIEQMTNETIGDLMELREMREGCCFHLLCGHTCFREVRRTCLAQRFDAALFHLQMKQKSISASAIAERLQGSDIGAG